MKVKEFLTYLQKCDPEDEVFMIQYDRGDTMDIAGFALQQKRLCLMTEMGSLRVIFLRMAKRS